MKIRQIQWNPFQIPLRSDFGTARGTIAIREGLIVRLTTDEGIVGIGEIAPLPVFSGARISDSLDILRQLAPTLIGRSVEDLWNDAALLDGDSLPARAAVRCGLEVAAGDAFGRGRGVPLAFLLADNPVLSVPVNATIALADGELAAPAARDAVANGFDCVKVKVGMARSIADEVGRIEVIRDAIGPECRLRLDANGAWDVDRAVATITALEKFDLDLVEQPVSAGDLAGLAKIRRRVNVRIGADEAVTSVAVAQEILDHDAADVFIVKPMAVGGLGAGKRIIELAQDAGRTAIVTTTIDSGVGIAAALQLAATLAQPIEACGLATGRLLVTDLLRKTIPVRSGWMTVPNEPGLGVDVDDEQLRSYRSGTLAAGSVGAGTWC